MPIVVHTGEEVLSNVGSREKEVTEPNPAQGIEKTRGIFVGDAMKVVNLEITRLARLDFDVLIEGETGVGKDLVAFALHDRSRRSSAPFVQIAIKSLSETLIESELFGHERGSFSGAERMKIGKLEAADGGTVYIPEVSSLTETVQLKLLQFLQYKTISRVGQDARHPDKKIDVRVILATNEALEEHVRNGRMREDFYHRISGVKITIPPLRERLDEIEALAHYFLERYTRGKNGESFSIQPEVLIALKLYRWPGNVRELENIIRSGIAHTSGDEITLNDIQRVLQTERNHGACPKCMVTEFDEVQDYESAKASFRRAYFCWVLRTSGYNTRKAAERAGMTPQGFRKILRTLGIKV